MRLPITGVLLLSACSTPYLVFEPPPREGAESIVFGVHASGGIEAYAFDVSSEEALQLVVEISSGPIAIEALVYEQTLDQLGVASGRLIERDDLSTLPVTGRVSLAGELDRDGFSGWSGATPSAELAMLRIASPRYVCPQFEANVIPLDPPSELAFALPVAADSVLVGTRDAIVRLVTPSGVSVVESPAELAARAGTLDDAGDLWLASADRTLWRGRFDPVSARLDAQRITTATIADSIRFLDGVEGELYLLDYSGGVFRFDGARATKIHQFGTASPNGGVAFLKPGEAIIGISTEPRIVHLRDGVIQPDYPPLSFGPSSIQRVRGFDVLVGAEAGGGVYRRSADGTWSELAGSPIQVNVTAFGAKGEELLAGGGASLIAVYRDGEWCPEQQVGSGVAKAVIPFGSGWLVVQDGLSDGERSRLVFLEEAR